MNRPASSPLQARLRHAAVQAHLLFGRFKKAAFSLRTLISLCGILILGLLFCAAITPVRYNISVGMVPTHTITANRDVVDEVTTETLRQEAADAVQPTYHFQEGVVETIIGNFEQIFAQLDSAIQYSETLEDYGPTRRYSAEELEYARTIVTLIELRDYQLRTLLNTPRSDLASLYTNLYAAIQNTMSGYVIEGSENIAIANIMQIIGYQVDTSLLQNVVQPVLSAVIQPNIIIDQEATEAARELARESVEPIVYKQGQNIVVKGEGRVERYQYEMLSNLGLLSNATIDINIYLGGIITVVLACSIAMVLMRLTDKALVHDGKRMLLLFTIIIITLAACILMRLFNIYLAPITLTALLLSAMMGLAPGVIFNAFMALLVSTLAAGGSTSYTAEMVQLLSCSLLSGTIGAMMLYRRSNRLHVIVAGVSVGICNFAVILALGLMTSSNMNTVLLNGLWGLASGAIAGLLCIALQPLLELVFNLPTPTKLMELSNPNHPLLRRLLLEAPGTYHHSIVVSSLAEAAAEAIGANSLLARVGGYYHDVGKLRRPQYFKENQLGGENKLVETDPYTAAQIVLSHTSDGVTLAHNYHLPREVTKIIQEHHGNTPVMYFYTMALNESNGKPVDVEMFRYNANPPSTKEGAIVMLCDTIEAAVRSMQNPTPDAIEEFIIKLIRGKLQDGQLSNSPLTLKDIDDICHACATVLNGVFHERIEYPDPPAELKPAKEHGNKTGDSDDGANLQDSWDGLSEEEIAPDSVPSERSAAYASITEPLAEVKQILVDPAEFEPDAPLPIIEPPAAEAPLTIDEALEELADAEQRASENDKNDAIGSGTDDHTIRHKESEES